MKKLLKDQNKINYNFSKLLNATFDTDIQVSTYNRKHCDNDEVLHLYLHSKNRIALKLSMYNYYVDEVRFTEIMKSVAAMLLDTDSPYNAEVFNEYKNAIQYSADTCDTYAMIKEYFNTVYWQDLPLTV